jgi:hypothetical protein
MPFIEELLQYDSVSIVGLEKNTGKTECLNYLLKRVAPAGKNLAVTSVGMDGERVDQVTGTAKPEIFLREGVLFATSEKHYKMRGVHAEILEIGDHSGSLGRLITARALTPGKILLSGPSTTNALKEWMDRVRFTHRTDLCIIDGALSRLSQASPAVSSSMILTTGAALSLNINHLVFKSAFVINLVKLPVTRHPLAVSLKDYGRGAWLLNDSDVLYRLYSDTPEENNPAGRDIIDGANAIFVGGALTDRLLKKISADFKDKGVEVIIRDFTRVFASERSVYDFTRGGGALSVLQRSHLIAICVNPLAPNGARLNSDRLCKELEAATGLPAYDIMKTNHEA